MQCAGSLLESQLGLAEVPTVMAGVWRVWIVRMDPSRQVAAPGASEGLSSFIWSQYWVKNLKSKMKQKKLLHMWPGVSIYTKTGPSLLSAYAGLYIYHHLRCSPKLHFLWKHTVIKEFAEQWILKTFSTHSHQRMHEQNPFLDHRHLSLVCYISFLLSVLQFSFPI